jgi:membrane-bound transcription factor site-1 protease
MGRLNLIESQKILEAYTPRTSITPASLDLTDCPYAWPFCQQAIYHDGMPLIFNATILNGMGVVGYVEGSPRWEPTNEEGKLLDLQITHSDVIWPWTGKLEHQFLLVRVG